MPGSITINLPGADLPANMQNQNTFLFGIMNSVTNAKIKANSIGNNAFRNAWGIQYESKTKIDVTTIGASAFYGCRNSKRIWLSKNVQTVQADAFYYSDDGTYSNKLYLYCELPSKPSGYDATFGQYAYYSYTYTRTTYWGVSEASFDAL